MELHKLKTWREPFLQVVMGLKTAEFRENDRGFEVGDLLLLREWDNTLYEEGDEVPCDCGVGPSNLEGHGDGCERFTGESVLVGVTHIVEGPAFGIPEGFVVMSISRMVLAALDEGR